MEIKHDIYSNCAQDVFLNILRYYELDEKYLLSSGWNFFYDCINSETKYGERIDVYSPDLFELIDALKQYYGIELVYEDVMNIEDAKSIVGKYAERNQPLCLYMDSYYCSWQPGYKKYHNMHMLIIQGSREDGFICADPYLNKGEVFLNDTDFCSSKKQLITIKFLGCNKVNDRDVVVNSLHNLIQKKSNGNVFDMMREFSRDLRENKALLDAEMNTNELAFISIVRKINYLCYGRLSYKKFLEGVMKESGNKQYEQYVEKIEILGRRWSILANRMVKYKLQGYPQSVFLGICDEMLDIAEEENNIAVKLMGEI